MNNISNWYGGGDSPVYPDWPTAVPYTEGDWIVLAILVGWIPALILIGRIQWWVRQQIQRRK